MYKLPNDISNELKIKYKINIDDIFNDIITRLINKLTKFNKIGIRGIGNFFIYRVFNKRIDDYGLRIKFRVSESLRMKIAEDDYIFNNTIIKDAKVYNNE